MSHENARDEYTRMVELVRHYVTLQFAELSVFIAIMSAAVAFLFGPNAPKEPMLSVIKAGVALIALCLWIVQESNSYQMSRFLRRAVELEAVLGYKGFSTFPGMPEYRLAPGKWAFRALYFFMFCFWVAATLATVVPFRFR